MSQRVTRVEFAWRRPPFGRTVRGHMPSFHDLGLSAPVLRAVGEEGYTQPTPIQAEAVPFVLAGRDLLGCAQTGTGKTAAFALPMLDRLAASRDRARRGIRALVLAPTRELASQIGESFDAYGRYLGLRCAVITGGVSQGKQEQALARGVDILVACPGRLLDLLGQRLVALDAVEIFVLDEADRMLDMGFIHDVRRIAALVPKQRQTLFFSATMPEEIRKLAASLLVDPAEVAVTPVASTAETIDQVIYFVEKEDKRRLLEWVLDDDRVDRALVFTRTKHGADRVARHLERAGIHAAAIHGDKSQGQRERALAGFKTGELRALVATDIAARGIDVDRLAYVVNFDLPNVPETYVHRIGRTGRAGAEGRALSFCDESEREYLVDIERLIRKTLPAITNHPYPSPLGLPPPTQPKPARAANPPKAGRSPSPSPKRSTPPAGTPKRSEGASAARAATGHGASAQPKPASSDAALSGEPTRRRRRRRRRGGGASVAAA